MIRVVDLTVHYGIRPVLRGINLDFVPGQLVAILGPNGMGKSTLLSAMAGILAPVKGYVEIDGVRRRESPETELAIRKNLVVLADRPWLPKERTGREFLMGVGRLYGHDDDSLMEHVDRLLDLFALVKEAEWPIRSYSNGQQKKVAVCSALVSRAPSMILDEPFSGGLDPAGILALKRVLVRLAHEEQATIVMATPVPELLEEIADRVIILQEGRVAADGNVNDLCRGAATQTLAEALEKLVHSQTLDSLRRYFTRTTP
jgi:ABC-type multidrug transport system ATPase subunit